jgi:hypothetical protein
MKYLLLAFLLFYSLICRSQSFATLDNTYYYVLDAPRGIGIDFTGGAFLKDKDNGYKQTFVIGAGIGIHMMKGFGNSDMYVPIFAQIGYFNKEKKITPYINGRIGYGIYNGAADWIKESGAMKGGLYSNIRAGAGFKLSRKFSLTPFLGASLLMFKKVTSGEQQTYNVGVVNAGLCFLFNS